MVTIIFLVSPLTLFVRQGSYVRLDPDSEESGYPSIDGTGLGQRSSRSGEGAHLAGIYDCHRQASSLEGCSQRRF